MTRRSKSRLSPVIPLPVGPPGSISPPLHTSYTGHGLITCYIPRYGWRQIVVDFSYKEDDNWQPPDIEIPDIEEPIAPPEPPVIEEPEYPPEDVDQEIPGVDEPEHEQPEHPELPDQTVPEVPTRPRPPVRPPGEETDQNIPPGGRPRPPVRPPGEDVTQGPSTRPTPRTMPGPFGARTPPPPVRR